jgi:GrpB-like predicted nucleotidyltransferase (UPF0157 family)
MAADAHSLGLGLEAGANRLVEHNPLWDRAFADEAARISLAVGPLSLAIEHYGSTAVPGLRAKPIIDLLIGVATIDDGLKMIEPMERIGYDYATTTASRTTTSSVVRPPGSIWPTWSSMAATNGGGAYNSAIGSERTPRRARPTRRSRSSSPRRGSRERPTLKARPSSCSPTAVRSATGSKADIRDVGIGESNSFPQFCKIFSFQSRAFERIRIPSNIDLVRSLSTLALWIELPSLPRSSPTF